MPSPRAWRQAPTQFSDQQLGSLFADSSAFQKSRAQLHSRSMFKLPAVAFGVVLTLTSVNASPARLPGPPSLSLAARACEGSEPYVRLNAADWTQIINIFPNDPTVSGYTRLGGMGAPNSTIDLQFKDDYNQEEIRLATYKEGGTMKP